MLTEREHDASVTPPASAWPLVGRMDELVLAARAISAGGNVALTGDAGVGKSRLARELLDAAAHQGDHIEWIAATESATSIPFGAIAHWLPTDQSASLDHAARLAGAAEKLAASAPGRRILLGVDDAHLLDAASASWIHLVATRGIAAVVVTFRSGEVVPEPITALWKDAGAPLVALQTLSRSELVELVTAVLGGPVEGGTVEVLWTTSEGNPLFLSELLHLGIESCTLRIQHGLWCWRGPLRPGERLAQLVARRTGRLDVSDQDALELLAVGEPLSRSCVRRLGIARALEGLSRRGVVATHDEHDRDVRLAHPLFGEVVRGRIPALRLDEIRRQLADAVSAERSTGDERDRFKVALWRAQCDDLSEPGELRWAARRALLAWEGEVAEQLARAALRSGVDLEAGFLYGESLRYLNRGEEADAAFAATEDVPGPDAIRAQIASGWATALVHLLGRRDEAREMLDRTIARLTDSAARERVKGALLAEGLVPATDSIIATSGRAVDPSAAFGLAFGALARGAFDAAICHADGALADEAAWVHEVPVIAILVRLVRVWATALAGRPLAAAVEADAQYRAVLPVHAPYPRGCWCLARGSIGVLRGGAPGALEALVEARVSLQTSDEGLLLPTLAYLAMARSITPFGADAAERTLADAYAASRVLDALFGAEVDRAAAWVHAARGDLPRARELAHAAASGHRAREAYGLEALALHDVARFGGAGSVVERLVELAGTCSGSLVPMLAEYARARAGDHDADLLTVAHAFAGGGFPLFAAEAAAAAAALLTRSGRRASALAARELLAAQRLELGGATTPGLLNDSEPLLTSREREVAILAARGFSSRVIAEQLEITARTVDNLLGRVYAKLGISGRRALRDFFASPVEASADTGSAPGHEQRSREKERERKEHRTA